MKISLTIFLAGLLWLPVLYYAPIRLANPGTKTADFNPGDHLLPIEYRGRYGFINQHGQVVIATRFRSAGSFSDGLAPARIEGLYGFINAAGEFAISPAFDYAEEFSEGLALVWRDSQPFFITPDGRKAFDTPFNNAGAFHHGRCKIELTGPGDEKLETLIDRTGRHLFEPVMFVDDFYEGLAILQRSLPGREESWDRDFAVVDTTGRFVVPFGRYSSIYPFSEGHAVVQWPGRNKIWGSDAGIINCRGELTGRFPVYSLVYDATLNNGWVPVDVPYYVPKTRNEVDFFNEIAHTTRIFDAYARPVALPVAFNQVTNFSNNRAFAGDTRDWRLIDRQGNYVGVEQFEWPGVFRNGLAAVSHKGDELYGVIDTNGHWRVPPRFVKIADCKIQPEGLLVAVPDTVRSPGTQYERNIVWGLISTNGHWIITPRFTAIRESGFEHGLLYAEIDSLYGYIDVQGEWRWSAVRGAGAPFRPDSLNIDIMLRAYQYVYPAGFTSYYDPPGRPRILAEQIDGSGHVFPANEFGISVCPDEEAVFAERYAAIFAYIFNTTTDTIAIDGQDNRLYLTLQARTAAGAWKDVEYSPCSWCGNSYYEVTLRAGEYWRLTVPVYQGSLRTECRLAFIWKHRRTQTTSGEWQAESFTIYSKPFTASINPGQFWRKQGHNSTGLMDPYGD